MKRVGYDPVLYGNYALIDGSKTSQDYFYAHLIAPPAIDEHERVRTGQFVGKVGQTGNAAEHSVPSPLRGPYPRPAGRPGALPAQVGPVQLIT